ncbi:putative epsilon-lactone hydrolase [Aspergillus steynii IBT 23096]|uniref:Putative epsilon-lactone hydrolase n=1 Tax=Aspergillus steynii IBT 23096 TaxID=1392250 RepID=A0A2I2G085_9EURO|nr:putative epsilon-lactone hydrolase [Aspergillus steynii IBT 23096]PLB46295.1 putative epsilon-lactone hydrolase [Aspergillus steynii IBT 23096]
MKHTLSIGERIDAWLGFFSIGAGLGYAAFCGLFRGPSGADTYHHHLIQAVTKKLTTRFTPLQLQYLFRTYDQLYLDYCQSLQIEPNFISNGRSLKGFWIGSPTARYVVINFHGGGFAMDATGPYLEFWPSVARALSEDDITTGWFNVTYTLTPHGTYPTQFREAVEALRYVLKDLGRSPSDVLLVGDSAGANLCLAVLSHLSHPSPDAPELGIAEPLKAIVLMSPWVSFCHDWPSMRSNEHKNIDARKVTERWSQDYLNGVTTNYYTEALEAPEAWWEGALVKQTLVLAGGDEVLLDSIMAWVRTFRKSNPDTTLVIGQNECHVAPLIWPLFYDSHETEQGLALKGWLNERLRHSNR